MTQPHLIEQAKQGDPQAIAALMNKSLQEKGMVAYVDRLGSTLEVILEAERVPNRQALTAFVEKGIQNLEIESIKAIKVSGKQFGSDLPAWTHDLYLETPTPEFEPDSFIENEPDFSTSSFDQFAADTGAVPEGDLDFSLLDGSPAEDSLSDDFLATGQSDFTEDTTSLFGEESVSADEPISDLSQLQDLLSEDANTGDEPHRQQVEDRLESLWAENSEAENQDFLSELLADDSAETAMPLEEGFLHEPTVSASNLEEAEFQDLWAHEGQSEQPSEEDFLNQLMADEPIDNTPDDEPDEVLLSFLEDTPTPPAIPTGDDEYSDEPDEILLSFLEREPDQAASNLETGDLEIGDLEIGELSAFSDLPIAEESTGLPEEEPLTSPDWSLQQEWVELPRDESGAGEQPLAATDQWQDAFSPENTNNADQTPPLDWLSESSEFNQSQDPSEEPDNFLDNLGFDQPEDRPTENTENFSLDWQDETPEPLRDAPVSEFIDTSSESLTRPTVPESPDLDLENLDFQSDISDEFTETTPWEEPPIELLQDDLEPPAMDMPTEQFDEPLIDFFAASSGDPQNNRVGEFGTDLFDAEQNHPLDEFPEDFLQESEPFTQQPDLVVEPGSNPFLEQLGEQAEPPLDNSLGAYSPDADATIAAQEFNPSDWQPVEEEAPDLGSAPFSSQVTGSTNEPDNGSDDDDALIDFFQDEPRPPAAADFRPPLDLESLNESLNAETDVRPPLDLESLNTAWQFENASNEAIESANRPVSAFEPEFEPEADWQSNSMEGNWVEPMTTPPDETAPEAGRTDSDYAGYEEPGYEEPSQEALEEQLARFDSESTSGQEPIEDTTSASVAEPRSPWLFPLILLGISGWIVGLISFAFLWSKLSSPPTSPESTAVSSPAPGTVAPVAAPPTLACTPAAPTTSSKGIDLTSIQFQPNTANPQQVNVVGCLTNRTQQPIDIVSVAYRAGNSNSSTIGGLSFADKVIQPGQTIAFTSKFTLPSETTRVAIDTLYWQQAGAKTSQEAKASLMLNR